METGVCKNCGQFQPEIEVVNGKRSFGYCRPCYDVENANEDKWRRRTKKGLIGFVIGIGITAASVFSGKAIYNHYTNPKYQKEKVDFVNNSKGQYAITAERMDFDKVVYYAHIIGVKVPFLCERISGPETVVDAKDIAWILGLTNASYEEVILKIKEAKRRYLKLTFEERERERKEIERS